MAKEPPTLITIDLQRLTDHVYMEVMTGTEAWSVLESYFRDTQLVSMLEQIRDSRLSDAIKLEVTQVFLRSLSTEERARIDSLMKVSDLLDTLIEAKN